MSTHTLSPDLEYYIGKLQPQYESDGHARIGQMLDQYGVPFFYKQATLICDKGQRKLWHPDFTLHTYNNAVIEYNPNEDRTAGTESKSDVYRQNSIAAIFLNQSDLSGPNWQQRIYDRLEEIYHQPFAHIDNHLPQDHY